ncbi:MAG: FHA domain-containing protein [Nannocystaceae bacterium]
MAEESDTTRIRAPAEPRVTRRAGPLALVILSGISAGRSISIKDREVLIGRGDQVDLQIPSDDISRKHAKIILDVDGIAKIVDLRSINGTYVNGRRVEVEVLREGDRVRIGMQTILDVRYGQGSTGSKASDTEDPAPDGDPADLPPSERTANLPDATAPADRAQRPDVTKIPDKPPVERHHVAARSARPAAFQTIPATDESSVLNPVRNFREAVGAYYRVLEMREKRLGSNHPSVAAVLLDIAHTLSTQSEHHEAEEHLQRALAIYESQKTGTADEEISGTLIAIGDCCLKQGAHVQAADAFSRAVQQRESDGSPPGMLAPPRFGWARALGDSGTDTQKAAELANQARSECAESDQQRHLIHTIDRWLAGFAATG